jgi:hypothetical protein
MNFLEGCWIRRKKYDALVSKCNILETELEEMEKVLGLIEFSTPSPESHNCAAIAKHALARYSRISSLLKGDKQNEF